MKVDKNAVKGAINRVFTACEDRGSLPRMPAFVTDYTEYPELEALEEHYPLVRAECLALLDRKDDLTDVKALGGNYTAGGIHTIRWKSYMLKCGSFVRENCARCPETTALLERVPGLFTAFFSILEPRQYIRPHWGYYKGFVRYHLAVVIPNDNANNECWLRIQTDPRANATRDIGAIEGGEKHYWRNGKGFFFDDTYLHDAANDSDQLRVVLWLDLVRRNGPAWLRVFNQACVAIAAQDGSVRNVRKNAVVTL